MAGVDTGKKKPRKYATGALGFQLYEPEIGSGAFAKVLKAGVCKITWNDFVDTAKKLQVSEDVMKKLEAKVDKEDPMELLEFSLHSLNEALYGGGEGKPEPTKEEEARRKDVIDSVIESIKQARTETKECVAVKILESDHANWEDIRKELGIMRSMNHGNVVRVYSAFVNSFGADNQQELWIVMPLLAVGSCSSVLREFYKKGIKDPKILATILYKVLQALAYFHKDGQIHRDVKAGNILLSEDGEVQLADFGVSANTIEHGSQVGLRKTFVGTPCWMAPEVMEQRNGHNTKADIWSFGITAMELAYGYAPYAHEKAMKVLVLTLKNAPPTCEVYSDYDNPKFPRSFHKLIARCLNKSPSERPDAKKLMSHGFFKHKADNAYLKKHLIDDVMAKRKATVTSKPVQPEGGGLMKKTQSAPLPIDSFCFPEGTDDLKNFRKQRDTIKKEVDATKESQTYTIGDTQGLQTPESKKESADGVQTTADGVQTTGNGVRAVGRFRITSGSPNTESPTSKPEPEASPETVEGTKEPKKVGRFTVIKDG
uniref:Protein kinase domain-containing protein n=1 Tax=Lotharella oceanica TaxID=641309 RepID=A0A7S2X5Q1_9EUKA|mmetsp:Transcript_1034/g.1932  ORF Transcript_1034/g.1932 Transcript_1034/m.1932 type:complete len:541 (+) Transcript_1034:40-1662(+)